MTAREQIAKRKTDYQRETERLALERVQLWRRIEEIDKTMGKYDAAIQVCDVVLRDLDTEAAIVAAKENE